MVDIHERDGSLGLRRYKRVAIVGIGGVGSNLALQLTLSETVKILDIYDNDTVSESNLSRTPYRMVDVGRKKVYAMKDILDWFGRDIHVNAYDQKVFGQLNERYDLIIDCRDYIDEFTKFSNIIVGYDGKSMTVHVNPSTDRIFAIDNEHHGYTTQSYIVPPTIGAGIITQYLMRGEFVNTEVITTINIEDFVQKIVNPNFDYWYSSPKQSHHQVKGREVMFDGQWVDEKTDKTFGTYRELLEWIDTNYS